MRPAVAVQLADFVEPATAAAVVVIVVAGIDRKSAANSGLASGRGPWQPLKPNCSHRMSLVDPWTCRHHWSILREGDDTNSGTVAAFVVG